MQGIKQTISQFSWLTVASGFTVLSQAALFFVVAHYIDPETIGQFALALALSSLSFPIVENAFSNYLLDINTDHRRSLNEVILMSLFLKLIVFILVATMLWSFEDRIVFYLFLALLPFATLTIINLNFISIAKKEKNISAVAQNELFGNLLYVISGISLILLFQNVWVLLAALLIKAVVQCFLWVIKDSSLLTFASVSNFKGCWNYGKYIIPERTIGALLNYADIFLISWLLGNQVLGVYEILKRIALRPILIVYGALEQIYFILFSEFRKWPLQFVSYYKELNDWIQLLFVNAFLILVINYKIIMRILPDFYMSYEYSFRLIAVLGIIMVIMNPLDIICYSQFKVRRFFYWVLSYSVPLLVLSVLTLQYGIEHYIAALTVFYTAVYIIAFWALDLKSILRIKEYIFQLVYPGLALSLILLLEFFGIKHSWVMLNIIIALAILLQLFNFQKKYFNSSIFSKYQ